ncbi:uncharacterized protein N7482_004293 [Penicillium canariense]|uniref:Uncharacterized protein n=1 Tax=Penicillium canariense TaxID=189055 RepID=A0A9W9LP81_9EURO|nr:uncharacterized protein N7482_004293 [Penicillium canariense]KAJ5168699.1 hypothetical protein N7482_004293 [Penicillium canariense]
MSEANWCQVKLLGTLDGVAKHCSRAGVVKFMTSRLMSLGPDGDAILGGSKDKKTIELYQPT